MATDPVAAAITFEHKRSTKELSSNCTETALIDAATSSNLHTVGYLLSQGVDIHTQENEALISVCKHGYLQMLVHISMMEEAEYYDIDRIKKLSCEANLKMIRYLVRKGANVHTRDGYALIAASYCQSMEVFELLVDLHGDISSLLPYLSSDAVKRLSKYTLPCLESDYLLKLVTRYC